MTLPKPVFVIGLRFTNIVAAIVGKTKAWGLSNYLTVQSAHNTIPYFYPIWAMKESAIPHLAALIVVAVWFLLIIMLIALLFRIYTLCKSTQDGRVHPAQNHHVIIGVGESI